jgi:hypothetical protein
VDRICLLDSWNHFDSAVPEALKITSLPNTIERYMLEETGKSSSCIRRMNDKDRNQKRTQHHKKEREPITDKYCHFCGAHGHITVNCEFMAKLLTAMEQMKKVDQKSKKELQENFEKNRKNIGKEKWLIMPTP